MPKISYGIRFVTAPNHPLYIPAQQGFFHVKLKPHESLQSPKDLFV